MPADTSPALAAHTSPTTLQMQEGSTPYVGLPEGRVFVDTNIFVYAFSQQGQGCVSSQVLHEF